MGEGTSMRGAADTPGRRAARSRIRGLALAIGGVCAAATGPDIMAQRQALFFLPWRVFAGDIPGLEIGRFRTPPEPPSKSPSGWPSPPPALALGFLATCEDRNGETRRGRARLRPTAPAGPPAARRAPVSVGFGAGWPRPPKRRRRRRRRRAAAATTGLETALPTAPPEAVFRLLPARDAAQSPSRSIPAPRSRPALCLARYGIEWHGVCGAPVGRQTLRGARRSAALGKRAMGRQPAHQPGAVAHGDTDVASV